MPLGDEFSLALGHFEAAAGQLKECKDKKNVAKRRASLGKKENDWLTGSFSSLKNLVGECLVGKESSDADIVAFGVERYSLKRSLAARDAELKGLRVRVGVK